MGHSYILIHRPRNEKVCRGRRKSKEIPRRLQFWIDGNCCQVRAKDQRIKDLKKRVVELEAAANKDLCVLAPVKADAATTKEQRNRGATCEEQGNNDGKEQERKDEEEMDEEIKDDEDEEEEEKVAENEQKKEKIKEEQDDKKGKKKNGKDKERKEKECEKEEEIKYGDDYEERDHNPDNEYNDMNEENQTKHRAGQVSCHHEVEMNKKLESISRKLDFEQDVNFNRNELVEKQKSENFDSSLSTTPAKRAKRRNEKRDHTEEKKTIPE
ncbi:hypothetical protein CDL12_03730 [Handroanthus impetiginosus]|uniref:Ubiquitinyl hydrolase 1 n=1 Tax=Handroanthus impetiginosus TaxID=429701 RepID=A0A2G9I1A0_9LAMI|nr:hypothetical protein CDL12_03730 [Handroanthus impetiginosus]